MRDWSWWRFANNSCHAESLSRLLKPQTNRTTGPPGVNEDGSRFPGKSNPLQTRLFFISIAPWSVEENDTIMSKVAKSKGKPAAKMEKPQTVLMSKTMNRHTAFKITIRGDCFLSRLVRLAWRGGTSFLTSFIASFGSTATSLFKIWTPAWSSTSISRFHRGIFFFSWQNDTPSFFFGPVFFPFLYRGLSSAFDFSMNKDFFRNKELPRVNFVKWAM